MNVLELLPGIGSVIEKLIPDKNKQNELKLELAKLDIQEAVERLSVLKTMLGHDSLFVAGGIPALLWLAVLYILFDFIVFPVLSACGLSIAPIELPEGYWTLLRTVVLGLFGKKIVDNNEWRWNGRLISPAKDAAKVAAIGGRSTEDRGGAEAAERNSR